MYNDTAIFMPITDALQSHDEPCSADPDKYMHESYRRRLQTCCCSL